MKVGGVTLHVPEDSPAPQLEHFYGRKDVESQESN
jgi:hypothetical protein